MSFSDLVTGGPSCGPSNPLQNLGKRFGQDRSSQLDRYDPGRGESSSHGGSFRNANVQSSMQADPSFFHQNQDPQHSFDLQPLQHALPLSQSHTPGMSSDFHAAWEPHNPAQISHFDAAFRHAPASAMKDPQWAREFSHQPAAISSTPSSVQQRHVASSYASPAMSYQGYSRMNMMGMHPTFSSGQVASAAQSIQQRSTFETNNDHSQQWDTAFTTAEGYEKQEADIVAEKEEQKPINPDDADEFAKTAGRLVSTVEHETSDKFKQSNFLNLMRKIRDRQAGIHGTDIVETSDVDVQQNDKGKGKVMEQSFLPPPTTQREAMSRAQQNEAFDDGMTASSSNTQRSLDSTRMGAYGCGPGPASYEEDVQGREMLNEMWAEEDARSEQIERAAMERSAAFLGDGGDVLQRQREDEAEFAKYQNLQGMHTGSAAAALEHLRNQQQQKSTEQTSSMEEEIDELEGADFVGRRWETAKGRGVQGAQAGEWDTLQKDWDAWQASSAGLQPSMEPPVSAASAPQYRFHAYNPYVGATSSPSAQASSFPADMQSVLEREAAVQQDPNDAMAWFDLGVKQQENEREGMAIAALHRAIQLDPTFRDAWLALAVSYTNESDRSAAYEAIERWVEAIPEYRAIVQKHRHDLQSKATQSPVERHERLTNLLMAIVRHGSAQKNIDADIQVALGVLFNASEDYSKAIDCFQTALDVRPDDWLLYNRLGATLSNSGRSNEALQFYQRALDLKPGFVRCHFNMSISCLNLKMFREAASHIYTALLLQSESMDANDASHDKDQGGVASSSLWETLRIACELMDRSDLAQLASQRNLDMIDPNEFWDNANDYMEPSN